MDRMIDLEAIVHQIVADYATPALKATTHFIYDPQRHVYTVLSVPDQPRKFHTGVIVMARIEGDTVVIDEDITDRPLVDALVDAGIPREKIKLAYLTSAKETA